MKHQGELILMGTGGHGAVVADSAVSAGFVLVGVLDEIRPKVAEAPPFGGVPWLGDPEEPQASFSELLDRGSRVHAAVGDSRLRRRWLEPRLDAAASIIHPSAIVSPSAEIGVGCFIGPRAVVNARARVGVGAIVNSGAIVEHDVHVGSFAHLAPASVLLGETRVEDNVLVGGNAVVLPGRRIGANSTVGAGAVVVHDVATDEVVRGIPARNG